MAVVRRRVIRRSLPRRRIRIKVVTRQWNGHCWVTRTEYKWV